MILLPVLLVIIYYSENDIFLHRLAASLLFLMCITDFLDGYLARKYSWQSKFGTLMDPIADKLLVCSIIMLLLHQNIIDIFPAVVIICREILISGLREFLVGIKVDLPVSKLGKIKTFMQMLSVFFLVLGSDGSGLESFDLVGNIMFWCAAVLTFGTAVSYMKQSFKYL
jgi:CDP-diacylglycerol--glycerol-3-phosphate 3-phosphatidyltransferase